MGDGTNDSFFSPAQIGLETDWKYISAGEEHSLGIKEDGTLWAWGKNEFGQIGDGTLFSQNNPKQIGTDNDWSKIAAGKEHSFAIKVNGTLWAWGKNDFGQLGDSTQISQSNPKQIGFDNDWNLISAGASHSLGIKKDGSLWAWGDNRNGDLGDGTMDDKIQPTRIGTENDWKTIDAGLTRSTAIKTDQTLWKWGTRSLLVPTKVLCESASSTIVFKKEPNFKLYPNPVTDLVTIEASQETQNQLFVEIKNSLGEIILPKEKLENTKHFRMYTYPSGIYFAVISDGHNQESQSFFKY